MIVVTLGTIPYPFNRAICWINTLIEDGIINESVFIQYGVSNVQCLERRSLVTLEPLVEAKRFFSLVDTARLVISHGGQGSARTLAARGGRFVLLPRLKYYGEHIDDHQLHFSQNIAHSGVQYCATLQELKQAILHPPLPCKQPLFAEPKLADHLLSIYARSPIEMRGSLQSVDSKVKA
jgi:UDP-N-acetylglucosamine transferase subunit ALG13